MNELKLAEAAHEAAREALTAAVAEAERITERLNAGDETVTVAEAISAPAAVKVAEAKVKATARKLRQEEDEQPLPTAPALRTGDGVAEAGRAMAKAVKAAETARAGLAKAEHNLLTAQGKLDAAEGSLAEALAGDPSTAIHFANLLVNSGVTGCNVEVIGRGGLTAFSRGTLPVVHVAPNGAGSVSVCHLGRYANDALPDAEAISRALSLDGWAGGFGEWSEADEAPPEDCVMHTAVLELRPRGTLPWAGWEDAGSDERSADLLDGLDEILSEARHALRGGHRDMKVYTRTNRAPLALSVAEDGLHTVTVGLAVSHYTNGSTPLSRGADGEAMAKLWRALVGATDWMLGVVVKVEPVKGVPSWAAEVPMRVESARDTVVHYAKVTAVFRVAEGRTVNLGMLGLADAA